MKAILTKTVQRADGIFAPDTLVDWPRDIVEGLIDGDAAEPATDIRPRRAAKNRPPAGGGQTADPAGDDPED